nr:hypothetical protein [Tanacetum cinerariifolium]
MAGVDINTLTMEQYLALSQENQAPSVVKPEFGGNVNFEIKSQFIWVDRLTSGAVNTWDLLKKAFIQRYCLPSKTAKRLEDIHNFKQESDESLYQAWKWYNDLLYRCPTHDINSHQKVSIFYKGLNTMNRQLLDSHGTIPGMTPTQALTVIQTMADDSQKLHEGTLSRNISSSSDTDGLAAVISKLDNLGCDMKKLKENVYAIQVGCKICKGLHLEKECPLNEEVKQVDEVKYGQFRRPAPFNESSGAKFRVKTLVVEVETKVAQFKECKTIFDDDGTPLYTTFYYSPKEIKYFSSNSGFLKDERSKTTEVKTLKAIPKWKSNLPKQSVNHYVEPYVPPIPFSNRLKQHADEALVHKTMERLKKIKINQPFLKEIKQIDNYPRYMKDLVANKELTKDDGRLDFNNALADLGASISIMPFSMFKRLRIGKLEPINMVIEMADDTKCIPKGIVKNRLIKIDKCILPIDFIILDMIEDFRMPVILERPLLAIAHVKVDIF